jgi:cell division septation protein DedD
MQIICPNCGSKSPIEAGSLVTQTRIVCARCAVEFAAELSDEQKAAPAPAAEERGIELFSAGEVAPVFHAQPVSAPELAAPPPAEVASADEAVAAEPVVEFVHETLPAAGVSPAVEVAAVEAAPADQDSHAAAACDVYEVLSLPEEAVLPNEAVTRAAAAEAYLAAGADHSNVLEDVFAAWHQARESRPEADTSPAESNAAPGDYVTSPLSPDYEAAVGEGHRTEAELTEPPPAEVLETPARVLEASTNGPAGPVEDAPEEAAETADNEREPVHASFADAGVPPQGAAAQSFDGYGLGVRLMRVSPLWLLVSGLSFISFVVFCNWFFVPANLAQAEAVRPASRRNEATNRSLASAADPAAERPDSRNSGTSAATLPAEAEIVNASVKVEEPTPAPTAPPAMPAPTAEPTPAPKAEQPKAAEAVAAQGAPAGKYTVQVGSYNAPAEAEARAANLRSAGQSVRVVEVEIPKRGKWYRVYVGGFASHGEAESHGKSLRGRGLAESYIATEAQ